MKREWNRDLIDGLCVWSPMEQSEVDENGDFLDVGMLNEKTVDFLCFLLVKVSQRSVIRPFKESKLDRIKEWMTKYMTFGA